VPYGLEGRGETLDPRHLEGTTHHERREEIGRQLTHDLVERENEAAVGDALGHLGRRHREDIRGKLVRHRVPRHVHRALGQLGQHDRLRHEQDTARGKPRPHLREREAEDAGRELPHHALEGDADDRLRGSGRRHRGRLRDLGWRDPGRRDLENRDFGNRDGGQCAFGQRHLGRRDVGRADFALSDVGRSDAGLGNRARARGMQVVEEAVHVDVRRHLVDLNDIHGNRIILDDQVGGG